MNNYELTDLINFFDIFILIIILISTFVSFKNGLIKSVFNLVKWIIIILLIKYSFVILRPFYDVYITNSTLADIAIFLSVFIFSFIILSSFNRIMIGVIQPNKSGIIDHLFGSFFGIAKGYIIAALIFSLITTYFPFSIWPNFLKSGSVTPLIQKGSDFIITIPERVEDASDKIV